MTVPDQPTGDAGEERRRPFSCARRMLLTDGPPRSTQHARRRTDTPPRSHLDPHRGGQGTPRHREDRRVARRPPGPRPTRRHARQHRDRARSRHRRAVQAGPARLLHRAHGPPRLRRRSRDRPRDARARLPGRGDGRLLPRCPHRDPPRGRVNSPRGHHRPGRQVHPRQVVALRPRLGERRRGGRRLRDLGAPARRDHRGGLPRREPVERDGRGALHQRVRRPRGSRCGSGGDRSAPREAGRGRDGARHAGAADAGRGDRVHRRHRREPGRVHAHRRSDHRAREQPEFRGLAHRRGPDRARGRSRERVQPLAHRGGREGRGTNRGGRVHGHREPETLREADLALAAQADGGWGVRGERVLPLWVRSDLRLPALGQLPQHGGACGGPGGHEHIPTQGRA